MPVLNCSLFYFYISFIDIPFYDIFQLNDFLSLFSFSCIRCAEKAESSFIVGRLRFILTEKKIYWKKINDNVWNWLKSYLNGIH